MSTTNADSNAQANLTVARGSHHAQVERLRRWESSRRKQLVGVGMLSSFAVALLCIALADYFFELSGGGRLLLWGGTVVGMLMVLRLTRRWRGFASTDAVVAAEGTAPNLDSGCVRATITQPLPTRSLRQILDWCRLWRSKPSTALPP